MLLFPARSKARYGCDMITRYSNKGRRNGAQRKAAKPPLPGRRKAAAPGPAYSRPFGVDEAEGRSTAADRSAALGCPTAARIFPNRPAAPSPTLPPTKPNPKTGRQTAGADGGTAAEGAPQPADERPGRRLWFLPAPLPKVSSTAISMARRLLCRRASTAEPPTSGADRAGLSQAAPARESPGPAKRRECCCWP